MCENIKNDGEELTALFKKYISECGEEKSDGRRFPNLAGFCSFCGFGTGHFAALEKSCPAEVDLIRAALEDEALNSGMSSTVISAYLRERFFREKPDDDPQLRLVFDHDIEKDGG